MVSLRPLSPHTHTHVPPASVHTPFARGSFHQLGGFEPETFPDPPGQKHAPANCATQLRRAELNPQKKPWKKNPAQNQKRKAARTNSFLRFPQLPQNTSAASLRCLRPLPLPNDYAKPPKQSKPPTPQTFLEKKLARPCAATCFPYAWDPYDHPLSIAIQPGFEPCSIEDMRSATPNAPAQTGLKMPMLVQVDTKPA